MTKTLNAFQPKIEVSVLRTPDLYVFLTGDHRGVRYAKKFIMSAADKCIEHKLYMNICLSNEDIFPFDEDLINHIYSTYGIHKEIDRSEKITEKILSENSEVSTLSLYINPNTHSYMYEMYSKVPLVCKKEWLLVLFQTISFHYRSQTLELMEVLGVEETINSEARVIKDDLNTDFDDSELDERVKEDFIQLNS